MSGKRVIVSGLGRMGLRHLRGVVLAGDIPILVSRSKSSISNARDVICELAPSLAVENYENLEQIPKGSRFDAAIISSTSDVRPAQLEAVIKLGRPSILLEKPLAQSREKLKAIQSVASDVDVTVCLFRRTLPYFREFQNGRIDVTSPLVINVVTGASGIGCNGIHWIDFALFLSGSKSGSLLWGEIYPEPVKSGRGQQFKDFGGCGVFALGEHGSRLVLTQSSMSSVPTMVNIVDEHRLLVIDQFSGETYDAKRALASIKPNYLYGQDYERTTVPDTETVDWPTLTRSWLDSLTGESECYLPKLDESVVAHELMYDLLETSGLTDFAIT
jgi:hypothetical protein